MEGESSSFTWRIQNFSKLNADVLYSETFEVGGLKWRVTIYPKGDGDDVDYLSVYLSVADVAAWPDGWSCRAKFSLSVVNQIKGNFTIRCDAPLSQFNAQAINWGYPSFMPLTDIYSPIKRFLVNDTLVVKADVVVLEAIDSWAKLSKKETSYVGLKNQGATCYMNSLLQTLFHVPCFRKAVYHMPTTENDMLSGNIPLALQSLFYKLQYNDTSVATKELTKSIGWDTYDSFMQHDVQELNRVLCEKLEDKMKGTIVEGTIQQLFEGHHMNFVECINVDYKSTRKEAFYGLQLDVKGCQDVYASFDKYVEIEHLEGDSKYHADQYGLQEAKKGVLFTDFPPVLQLQLKCFEYDFMRDTMVKISDRYGFPLQLDLDRENRKYLSPDADRSVCNLYTLHSFLVHSGGVHGGHYFAYIRPTLSDHWYKFDDERVTNEDMKKVLEEQYSGEEKLPQTNPGFNNTPFMFTKYSNAYMLVYIRESEKDKIICGVNDKDIVEHLRVKLKKEQEEKEQRRKVKAEAHLYTIIKVARNQDLAEQIGKDIFLDLVDHDKVRSFRIQKQTPFAVFKEQVAKEFGIPVSFLRFWLWGKRQNHTYRPNRPLSSVEESQSVFHLRNIYNKTNNAELKLFLEINQTPDHKPVPLPEKTNSDILLFLKLYDPEKEELRYVRSLFVKALGKPSEILANLKEMAGFAPIDEIELFEEIRFEPNVICKQIDKSLTFRGSQLEDGGIICYQRVLSKEDKQQYRFPDVPSFLEYVHNRQIVHFRCLDKPKKDDFCLELSKVYTYDDVVERIARHICLDDPTKIRLTEHNCYSQQPKPQPIKYRGVEHLYNMLDHYNQTTDILYYEILHTPLPELQGLKTLKVTSHHSTKDEVSAHTLRFAKQSTVGDDINDLNSKAPLMRWHRDREDQQHRSHEGNSAYSRRLFDGLYWMVGGSIAWLVALLQRLRKQDQGDDGDEGDYGNEVVEDEVSLARRIKPKRADEPLGLVDADTNMHPDYHGIDSVLGDLEEVSAERDGLSRERKLRDMKQAKQDLIVAERHKLQAELNALQAQMALVIKERDEARQQVDGGFGQAFRDVAYYSGRAMYFQTLLMTHAPHVPITPYSEVVSEDKFSGYYGTSKNTTSGSAYERIVLEEGKSLRRPEGHRESGGSPRQEFPPTL